MSLEPGSLVGRFRVIRLIAQGGMAEVYRAAQELTGGILRPAALKVIRPEYSESPDFREMFLDEARLACTLSHPNIVHIYEVGESDGRLFMAMELVPGESLAWVARQLRDRESRFSDEALIAVGIFTCSALEAVHGLRLPGEGHVKLVHRDVSPHNLLLGPTGSLKLIDFGIAKAASNRNLTSPGVTKGKAGYFSPEQAMGKALDGKSDLFSLGVTLYKLAWGGTPFDQHKTHHERNTALVHGRWKPLREVCPGLPEGLYDIVDRALRVKPEERFADAAEMRQALEVLAVESGLHVGPSTLAGYVEPQPDDPNAQATRPLPGSGRHSRPQAARNGTLPVATAQAPASGVAITRAAPVSNPSLSSPGTPRRTERLAARSSATSTSGPTRVQLDRTRRRLLVVSGASVVLMATVVGLLIGTAARRSEEQPVARPLPVAPPPAPLAAPTEPAPSAVLPEIEVEAATVAPEPPTVPAAGPSAGEVAKAAVEERVPARRSSPKRRARARERDREEAPAARVEEARPPPRPPPAVTRAAPKGDGRLRIGGNDDGEIEVNGKKWGLSPLDRKVPAGSYEVVVRSLDGQKRLRKTVEVHPDRTAMVKFDFRKSAMTVSGN